MPRPKSELTGVRPRVVVAGQDGRSKVSVRWTNEHHIAYLKLGGSRWLRAEVEKHMEKNRART